MSSSNPPGAGPTRSPSCPSLSPEVLLPPKASELGLWSLHSYQASVHVLNRLKLHTEWVKEDGAGKRLLQNGRWRPHVPKSAPGTSVCSWSLLQWLPGILCIVSHYYLVQPHSKLLSSLAHPLTACAGGPLGGQAHEDGHLGSCGRRKTIMAEPSDFLGAFNIERRASGAFRVLVGRGFTCECGVSLAA